MNRVQKAAVIIITLLLVVLGTAYGAGYFYFGSHFLPGTELNEFDVSFKTAAEVQDLLLCDCRRREKRRKGKDRCQIHRNEI